jgi:pyruvate dehydrogenase phosphatase
MDGDTKKDTQPIRTTTFHGWAASLVRGAADVVTASWAYGPWGQSGERQQTHLLLSPSETEGMLHANERTITLDRPGNPLWRYDTNFIPGNKRTEDAHAVDILSKDDLEYLVTEQTPGSGRSFWERWSVGKRSQVQSEVGKGNKDIVLASVFDGHNDTHVLSELLSKTLHATLARNLGIQRQRQDSIMDDATRIETVKSLIIET